MTDWYPVSEQPSQKPEIPNFSKKFELPDKSGFELMETRRAETAPPQPDQPPFIN